MRYLKALDIIKQFEGCKLDAYPDGEGVPTIGYGTTKYPGGGKVQLGDKITLEQAEEFLIHHCESMEDHVRSSIKFPDLLSDNQMQAICSWTYNIGDHAEATSTLIKRLNLASPLVTDPKVFQSIGDEFLRWNKDNGKVVAGLTNRRKLERDLFLTPDVAAA